MQPLLLFESLFNRNIAHAGNAEFLKQIAEEHPYFSPAQFFLLQNISADKEAFKLQAAKTGILFNNPYWLNFQLLQSQEAPNKTVETIIPAEEEKNIVEAKNDIEQTETVVEPEAKKEDQPIVANAIVENEIIFQPLYTSDYFASQGIKLTEETQLTDKLSRQLKSFTDWLKTMKKIGPENIPANNEPQTDSTIQTLAEKSNDEGEVLTETMAEIFSHQGKTDKAIETYQKLSLLNPAKSAYFAAKIEQLKGI